MGSMAETEAVSYWCHKYKETKISDSVLENSNLNSYLYKKIPLFRKENKALNVHSPVL